MIYPPFQNEIAQFVRQHDLEIPVWDRMLDLTSEMGELAKEILKASDYGRQDFSFDAAWRDELGDVLFSLVCLANSTEVNLLDALRDAITKYQIRLTRGEDAGSENG